MNPFLQVLKQRAELEDFWVLPASLTDAQKVQANSAIGYSEPPEVAPIVKPATGVHVKEELQMAFETGTSIDPKYTNLTQYQTLDQFLQAICDCTRCELGNTRTKFVFGVGSPSSELMFIGEAPGADEDAQGIPFVGRAGKLLTEMLTTSGFIRDKIYIANVLKCRPPGNRDPLPSEVAECEGYLHRQIELLQPKLLVALGRIAATTLLRKQLSMAVFKQSEHSYHDVPLLVTYHPAYILRDPNRKGEALQDFTRIRNRFIELGGTFGLQ
ncbi:MAG: uracil-DNA glycosylase [bacterium]|nr:uracil-DNA glycosylase [bacterium]